MCIDILAKKFNEIITDSEWEKDWICIDRDQLMEFLKCNELVVPNEYVVWEGVQKWLKASAHPERRGNTSSPLLVQILPLIRFPFMSAVELGLVENSTTALQHPKLLQSQTHLAYKFISLPLSNRTDNRDFMGQQFVLRNYTDIRWERRFTFTSEQLYERNHDHTFNFSTKSNTFTLPSWEWSLSFQISQSISNTEDELRVVLTAIDVDLSSRSLEYLLMIHDETKVIRTIFGTKMFTKSRYNAELDLQNRLKVQEIFSENSPLLVNRNLNLQLILRPIL